jgi:hypothetical protein
MTPEYSTLAMPDPPRGGRPGLSFNDRRDFLLIRNEIINSLVRRGRATRDPVLRTLIKQIGRARERGNILQEARLSRKADRVGRFNSTPILKPADLDPALDRMAIEEFEREKGKRISERTARRIREDEPLVALVGKPVYEVPDWLVVETRRIWLRRRASGYLTPEVLAKVDRGEVALAEVDGRICVGQVGNGVLAGFPHNDILAGAVHRVGCEEPFYRRRREDEELTDIPRAKFIPAKRWVHLWPGEPNGNKRP